MKRFAPLFILLAASIAAAPLSAATSQPLPFNTVVVDHFTNSNGMALSQNFIQYFADDLSEWLVKDKVAANVVDQGTAVPDSVAAKSLVIDGRFLSHEDAGLIKPGKLLVEINVYRLSDHALVKTWTATTHFPIKGDHKERSYAYYTGTSAADMIADSLKGVDLSSIPPAGPGSSPATPGSSPAATSTAPASTPNAAPATPDAGTAPEQSSNSAPANSDAAASVQLSSDPTGAEITIDGSYVGNTPTLIKLKPGTHSITITLPGYTPWMRSIETAAGESRNFAAALEKSGQ